MIVIDDVLISDDIIERKFVCNLNACKGACCWEGDYGAPLTDKEIHQISADLHKIKTYLDQRSQSKLEEGAWIDRYTKDEWQGTRLHEDGSCIFLTKDELGISKCGIEFAHKNGDATIQKPLSCHLYPIRVTYNPEQGFEAWNYDKWDICTAACTLGDELKVPVYQFLKSAIIRAKGEEFYEKLEAVAHRNDC